MPSEQFFFIFDFEVEERVVAPPGRLRFRSTPFGDRVTSLNGLLGAGHIPAYQNI